MIDLKKERLVKGIAALGLSLSNQTIDSLLAYAEKLLKWNKTYNLTAITDPIDVIDDHLLDALTVLSHLGKTTRLLDVGTGGGVPGIPLAICRPNCHITLLDANSKKTAFLRQMAIELSLKNINVVTSRVENYRAEPFETIISRAFSSLSQFLTLTSPLLQPNGRWLAMKGRALANEIASLPTGYSIDGIITLSVPGSAAERHLIVVRRDSEDEA